LTPYPKSAKKTNNLTVFFAHLGSGHLKVAPLMLMKLTPGGAKDPGLARVYIKPQVTTRTCLVRLLSQKNWWYTLQLPTSFVELSPALSIQSRTLFETICCKGNTISSYYTEAIGYQFHQPSTLSFCMRRFQMHKKIQTLDWILTLLVAACKSCV